MTTAPRSADRPRLTGSTTSGPSGRGAEHADEPAHPGGDGDAEPGTRRGRDHPDEQCLHEHGPDDLPAGRPGGAQDGDLTRSRRDDHGEGVRDEEGADEQRRGRHGQQQGLQVTDLGLGRGGAAGGDILARRDLVLGAEPAARRSRRVSMAMPSAARPDLERLASLHPLRERLHRLLMVALYRGGRQADALALYRRLRSRLADELGIDPAREVQALAEAILRQKLAEPAAPRTPVAAPEVPTVPGADTPASLDRVVPPRASAPPALSSVIGRRDDVDVVLGLLADTRLVTLTGPGGVGKTTLALEVARHLDSARFPEVRIIRLAALEPGADVAEAFARQLGLIPRGPGEAATVAVQDFLADRPALLLVDNCEHVVDSAAALLERVLLACPEVAVLATSREALVLPGEVQVAVHPLPVPPEDADLAAIGDSPAVRLFLDRARAVRPSFSLDADSAPVTALICRQLDGVPLAIELAAARVKVLPVHEIATAWRTASPSCQRVPAPGKPGTVPCGRRSTGATSSCPTQSKRCCGASPCSAAAGPSMRRSRCVRPATSRRVRSWTCFSASSTGRW